jgi:hypothetical protein
MTDLTIGSEMRLIEQHRKFIEDYGYWMAVRHAVPGAKCPCIHGESEGPDDNCRICHGSGDMFVDHLVRGRKYTPRPEIGSEQRTPVGYVNIHAPMYQIESGVVRPHTTDYVMELVLDRNTGQPVRPYEIRVMYKIAHVDEMRDIQGKIAFFQIKTEEEGWEHDE